MEGEKERERLGERMREMGREGRRNGSVGVYYLYYKTCMGFALAK